MDALISDMRFAIRSLAKAKLFTIVALTSLALGIGANVTVFSLVNAIALKPLPLRRAGRSWSTCTNGARPSCAPDAASARRPRRSSIGETARGRSPRWARISSGRSPSPAPRPPSASAARSRPPRLFDLLGVHAVLGRTFQPDDDRIGAPPVVLLSDALWTRRYGADRRIVGQTIRVNGVAHTVIGVMPPRFKFPEFAELWVPFTPNVDRRIARPARLRRRRAAQARRLDARRPTPRWWRWRRASRSEYPETQKEWTAHATSLRADFAGIEKSLYLVMLGAVGFVLLIVCANLAGLLLARGAQRQKEIAIRLALGATRDADRAASAHRERAAVVRRRRAGNARRGVGRRTS